MQYSISIPQFDVDGFDGEGLRSYLTRAEELGFEGGWTIDGTSPVTLGVNAAGVLVAAATTNDGGTTRLAPLAPAPPDATTAHTSSEPWKGR